MTDVPIDDSKMLLRQQTTLARFGELALRSDDLDELLAEACRLVGEALGTDLAKVMELLPDGNTLLVRAGVGWNPGVVGENTVPASDRTSEGHALKTGEPMISPDIAKETRFSYPSFLTDNGVQAVANVLILGGKDKRPFGVLQIDSRKPRAFTDEDVAFLRSYANLLAAAVDRLHAMGELRDGAERLRASMDRQQAALDTGLIGFFEWDVPSGMITADKRFADFYGLDSAAVAAGVALDSLFDLVHPDDRAALAANVEAAIASLADYAKEFRLLLRPSGAVRWVSVRGHCYAQENGRPLRYTGTVVDVSASKAAEAALRRANEVLEAEVAERTRALVEANARLRAEAEERERVEDQLRQSHKMEAVGQLTGGIAHDFNNLLAGITGSLEMLRRRAAQGRSSELERYIDAALVSASRAAALTHRLLAFSRRQTLDPKPTNVNRLVAGMEDLFRRTVGPGIAIEMRLANEPWLALCDANQLENALLNLVINARDAMPDGGTLSISTANIVMPDRRGAAAAPESVPPGEHIRLSVADTGAGMPPEVVARAFDPFFTTKPIGQGTGLGLSMIYGFVQQSGGQVRLDSVPGRGTTAAIFLPRRAGAAADAAESGLAEPDPATASAVVLVVEDEPAVRMIIRDVLSERGYAVLEAGDARGGLDAIKARDRIDLLLTDVGLPGGMNGRQLADAARERRPGLKVLFITGYAEGVAVGNGLLETGMEVMTKPFALDALASRVEAMISR